MLVFDENDAKKEETNEEIQKKIEEKKRLKEEKKKQKEAKKEALKKQMSEEVKDVDSDDSSSSVAEIVDEDEEIRRIIEEKKRLKEEKKKQKEEQKKLKKEAIRQETEQKSEEIVVDNKTESKVAEIVDEDEEIRRIIEEKKKLKEEKKKQKEEQKKLKKAGSTQVKENNAILEEDNAASQRIATKVKKEKVKGHKFRNFMIFLFFLVFAGAATLALIYFMSPYKLELNGKKEVNVTYGATYEEEGATLKRFIFISNKKIDVKGEVDTKKIGNYEITYSSDSLTVKRIVHVIDDEKPKIIFLDDSDNGDKPFELNINGKKDIYRDVYALDNYDGEIENIDYEENIDISKIGEYEIKYTACDSSYNCATRIKKVVVKDIEAPVITLNKGDLTLVLGKDKYEEYGATAKDNYDQNLGEIKIEGTVDTSKIGEYEIKYSICDSSNNCSEKVRKVTVQKEQIFSGRFVSEPEIDGTLESVLILNADTKTASITLNYCEGITSDTGSYSVNGNELVLKLDYPWDDLDTFKFAIVDNNTLKLKSDVKACAPSKNEKFKIVEL